MSEAGATESPRAKAHHLLVREQSGPGGQALRTGLVLLIVISVTAAVLKSMPQIEHGYGNMLDFVLLITAFGFAVEYGLRIWIAPQNPGGAGATRVRLRYLFSFPGLVDLLPALALGPHLGLNLDWLGVVPIFKLLRYTAAFQFMVEALYSERRVLSSAGLLMLTPSIPDAKCMSTGALFGPEIDWEIAP